MKQFLTSLLLLSVLQAGRAQAQAFDVHVHLWNGEKSVQEYLAQLDETKQKVGHFGGIWMANRGKLEETRRKNDELIALSAKYPQMIPIGSVHPYDGEAALDELKRIAARGVRVIKLHPHTQKFDVPDARVAELCRRAGELGVVILMDNANIIPGDSENLFNLAVAAPKTKFVLTHMGALNFRFWNIVPLARTAKDFWPDNLWFEISGTVVLAADSPIEQEFIWTIRNVGVDRVLLGSDFPQLSLAQAVNALERLDMQEEEKQKILHGNAEALFMPKKAR
jgi:hypothetical protein